MSVTGAPLGAVSMFVLFSPMRLSSEAESVSSVPRAARQKAQSAAIARAMASICNDEQGSFGVMSGHDRNTLSPSECPLHQPAETEDLSVTRIVHQLDRPLLPRLEPYSRTRCNVEPHASRGSAIEMQSSVRLGKVIVRSDLDRAVTAVLDHQCDAASSRIQFDVARVGQQLTRNH